MIGCGIFALRAFFAALVSRNMIFDEITAYMYAVRKVRTVNKSRFGLSLFLSLYIRIWFSMSSSVLVSYY